MHIQSEEEYQQALISLQALQEQGMRKLSSEQRIAYNEMYRAVESYHYLHDPVIDGQWALSIR